jgi:NDP-sugar pyrophosphorylase family protein
MPPALILTAGLGTRLRPLTLARAKAAVPIAGEPLIRRIMRWLAAMHVTDLVLNLHHLPATITSIVGDGSDLGCRVRYSWEQPLLLGSAGGPRLALPILGADTFLIVNGDTLTDVDPAPLVASQSRTGALVTLALVPNVEHLRYGGVRLDDNGRVHGFVRPGPAAAGSFHFIGVQVAHRLAFERAPLAAASQSIGGVYDELIRVRPGSVQGVVVDASFHDVGSVADYWATAHAFGDRAAQHGRNVRIDPTADVNGSILWDDVEVGAGAVLEECIVADRVRVAAGVRHRRAVLVSSGDGVAATPF